MDVAQAPVPGQNLWDKMHDAVPGLVFRRGHPSHVPLGDSHLKYYTPGRAQPLLLGQGEVAHTACAKAQRQAGRGRSRRAVAHHRRQLVRSCDLEGQGLSDPRYEGQTKCLGML